MGWEEQVSFYNKKGRTIAYMYFRHMLQFSILTSGNKWHLAELPGT